MATGPRSPEAQAVQRLYKLARWKRIRNDQLQREPLCRMCEERGVVEPAEIVDHVEPTRGDEEKFWRGSC